MHVVTSFYIVNILGFYIIVKTIKCHEIYLLYAIYVNFLLIFNHKIIKLSTTYFFFNRLITAIIKF